MNMKLAVNKIYKNEAGASLVEYALLVAMIAVIAVTAAMALGGKVHDNFQDTTYHLSGESVTPCDPNHPEFPNC